LQNRYTLSVENINKASVRRKDQGKGGAVMINVIVAAAFLGVLGAKIKFYQKYSQR
jgi:Tfp pilus assembly major pilin PilA